MKAPATAVISLLSLPSLATSLLGGKRLYGVNYSLRTGPDWATDADRCKDVDRVRTELQLLKEQVTDRVRVYSMTDCDTANIMLPLTKELGLSLWLGIWVGPDGTVFPEERQRLGQLIQEQDFSSVVGMHVSSEAIFRGDIDTDTAIRLRNTIKEDMEAANLGDIPITVSDIIESNMDSLPLLTVDESVVTFNQFPFWDQSTSVNEAAQYMSDRVRVIEERAGGRQIILTETGWADAGFNKNANAANPESMAKFLRDFVCLAEERNWQYFWFTSIDSSWRRVNEGLPNDVEGHFGTCPLFVAAVCCPQHYLYLRVGLFHEDGTLKSHILLLDVNCTEPRVDLDASFLETSGAYSSSIAAMFLLAAMTSLLALL